MYKTCGANVILCAWVDTRYPFSTWTAFVRVVLSYFTKQFDRLLRYYIRIQNTFFNRFEKKNSDKKKTNDNTLRKNFFLQYYPTRKKSSQKFEFLPKYVTLGALFVRDKMFDTRRRIVWKNIKLRGFVRDNVTVSSNSYEKIECQKTLISVSA